MNLPDESEARDVIEFACIAFIYADSLFNGCPSKGGECIPEYPCEFCSRVEDFFEEKFLNLNNSYLKDLHDILRSSQVGKAGHC